MSERAFSVEEVAEAPVIAKAPPVGSTGSIVAGTAGGRDYLDGFLNPPPAPVDPAGGEVYEAVIAALRDIFDPEIPVNIYDLGLIYGVEVDEGHVVVAMTLTTPTGISSPFRTPPRRSSRPVISWAQSSSFTTSRPGSGRTRSGRSCWKSSAKPAFRPSARERRAGF